MEKFEVTILGCGSAKPSTRHFPSAQIVNVRDKLFMIDCGEGAQIQMCNNHVHFSRIEHIFLSHLHGDHCFGLIGLISTFDLLGRTRDLHIHAPKELEKILSELIEMFCHGMGYKVIFHAVDTKAHKLIFEDRSVSVYSIPLSHRVPCCGFLFDEKPTLPHIRREMIDFYKIPFYAINSIKEGKDWTTEDGTVVSAKELTLPAEKPRCYAYCSDTMYLPGLKEYLANIDVLYHEATFADDFADRSQETFHSTARQAATLAKDSNVGRLIIGHYSSRYDDESVLLNEAREVFPNTDLAEENMVISILPQDENNKQD